MSTFPEYVSLGEGGSVLVRTDEGVLRKAPKGSVVYWRPAGMWGIFARFQDDRLIVIPGYQKETDWIAGNELFKSTKANYRKSNAGYV